MTYIIGSVEYDNINTFLSIVSQYHKFKIKFIITEPKVKDKNIYRILCVFKNISNYIDIKKENLIIEPL
jgi:hypothetical protein